MTRQTGKPAAEESRSEDPRRSSPVPGELLLNPVTLAAAVVLLLNDIWFKHRWPSLTTGKLSDFAGLVVLPVFLVSITELVRSLTRRSVTRTEDAWVFPLISGLGFVFVKTTGLGATAYSWLIGSVRWPTLYLEALVGGESAPPIRPIITAVDPTDLIALLALVIPACQIHRRASGR